MTKYIVEGGLNFFDELNKSLNIEELDENPDTCLISNTELTDNYVTLDCNHKFNYEPLYNDILNHKTKYNSLERRQLKIMELRCPYCRHIQSKLLPPCDGFENTHGVNYIDEYLMTPSGHFSLINGYKIGTCCYESNSVINNYVIKCTHNYVKLLEEDGKTYCHYHKYFAAKAALKAKKLKDKEDAKIAKEQIKAAAALLKVEKANEKKANMELLKIAKANEKKVKIELLKIAKANENLQKKKVPSSVNISSLNSLQDDNYIITSENANIVNVCTKILISGKNKGKMCCSTIHNDNLCKRHYNIQQYVKDISHIIPS